MGLGLGLGLVVAGAHEARGLDGCVYVEAARELARVVGDEADGAPLHPAEARDDVLGVVGLDLEQLALVEDAAHLG